MVGTQTFKEVNVLLRHTVEGFHPEKPGVAAIIAARPQKPVLVVPAKADDLCADFTLKPEDRVYAASGVGAAVNVVAQEHNGVTPTDRMPKLAEEVVQRETIAVDVSNRNGGHVSVAK
jgi:hypothetical protein